MNVIDAAHKTVHNDKHGGSTAIAARMGMSNTVLNNKVSPTCSTHHLRLDEAVTIMEYTGDTSIIQAMAHRLGGVFTRVDDEATQASIIMTALSTSACQGDIMSEMQKALEDGRIDCNERDALQTKIQDAMVALRTLSVQIADHCEGNHHV